MSMEEMVLAAMTLAAAGLVGGFVAGLLGVGGGIVIVPLLVEVFERLEVAEPVRLPLAVGTSLATIMPTALSSMRAHRRKGGVDGPLLWTWAPGVALGAAGGAGVGALVGGPAIGPVFAVVCLVVAANMLLRSGGQALVASLSRPVGRLVAFGVGGVSAVMGIGGGTLSVPILTATGVPVHRAVGTSSALGLFIAAPATVSYMLLGAGRMDLPPASVGYVSLVGVLALLPTSVLAAPWGARVAHRIPARALSIAFGVFLLLSAARMAARVFFD